MNLNVPNEVKRGDPILADWLSQLVRCVKAQQLMPSADHLVETTTGGTTIRNAYKPNGSKENTIAPFTVYASGASKVKVTGGTLLRGQVYDGVTVADSSELTVADSDYVFLQRDSANVWTFANGAELPSDKLFYKLATVAVDGNSKVTVTLVWRGGNLFHENILRVILTSSGGAGGGNGTMASWTYKVATDTGDGSVELLTGASPTMKQARFYAWKAVVKATTGTLHIKADGSFELYDTNEVVEIDSVESEVTECGAPGS